MSRSLVAALALLAACTSGPNDTDTDTDTDTGTATDGTDVDTGPIACTEAVPVPAEGLCSVTSGSSGAVVLRGTVLTPTGVLQAGSVRVGADHRIGCVGCDCVEPNDTVVACGENVISPGLVNPHDHIGYAEGAPIDHGTTRYNHRHDWRGSLSTPTSPHGNDGKAWGEVRMLLGGVTSMVGSGYASGLVRNLDAGNGLEGLPMTPVNNETFPLGDSNESFHANCTWNYKLTEYAASLETAFVPHVAEGINDYAAAEFLCESRSTGGAQDFTEPNAAHVHAIGLHTEDLYRMMLDEASIVWSPRSNLSLYGITADVATFYRLGGNIALGTDWTYSGSIHSGRELACADSYNRDYLGGAIPDRDLWAMVTVNGARALGASSLVGSLDLDRFGDVSVFALGGRDAATGAYRAVIEAGTTDVGLVLRGGDPLYGEASTLAALGASCDALDVCGSARAICAADELGKSYAALKSQVSGAYPAFFCDTPTNEPTCVPSRPGEFTGQRTADDSDGDGIANSADSCPDVFNPVRPIDGGHQPDADADGVGDPCDPTPIPADLDGDGTANLDDVCPFDTDNQADVDADGKGDACDPCKGTPNPVSVCPPPGAVTSIQAAQDETTPDGAPIALHSVLVTAILSNGFTVQDPTAADPAWSGLYVYTGGAPTVARGHLVDVTGVKSEYFTLTELASAVVTDLGGSTALLAPAELTAAQAASEAYESVLVRLASASVTADPYDCKADNSACSDTGLWQLDSVLAVDNRAYAGTDWAAHRAAPVTGVVSFRFDGWRLLPRDAADFAN